MDRPVLSGLDEKTFLLIFNTTLIALAVVPVLDDQHTQLFRPKTPVKKPRAATKSRSRYQQAAPGTDYLSGCGVMRR